MIFGAFFMWVRSIPLPTYSASHAIQSAARLRDFIAAPGLFWTWLKVVSDFMNLLITLLHLLLPVSQFILNYRYLVASTSDDVPEGYVVTLEGTLPSSIQKKINTVGSFHPFFNIKEPQRWLSFKISFFSSCPLLRQIFASGLNQTYSYHRHWFIMETTNLGVIRVWSTTAQFMSFNKTLWCRISLFATSLCSSASSVPRHQWHKLQHNRCYLQDDRFFNLNVT